MTLQRSLPVMVPAAYVDKPAAAEAGEDSIALTQFAHLPPGYAQKLQLVTDPGHRRCYELLFLTSKTFATVIFELDHELRLPTCIYYLALRGLDTIEDDMTIPKPKKLNLLHRFHHLIATPGWNFTENGPNEKDRILLEEYHTVIDQFRALDPRYQQIIANILKKMGRGMAEFIEREVRTVADYNLYCHYVAGYTGHGFSQLFAASGLENPYLAENLNLANSMGLFLQKVNIIRDYHEDVRDGRCYWPRQIWARYANKLVDFTHPEMREQGLACLDELCHDALRHAEDCLNYLSLLRNPSCFKFWAIPQVMALATLAQVAADREFFAGDVRINKKLAIKLSVEATTLDAVHRIYANLFTKILAHRRSSTLGREQAQNVHVGAPFTRPTDTVTPLVHRATVSRAMTNHNRQVARSSFKLRPPSVGMATRAIITPNLTTTRLPRAAPAAAAPLTLALASGLGVGLILWSTSSTTTTPIRRHDP